MTFGYLLNAYPMTSTTFIRREIEAHERAGHQVDRFAVRPWDVDLVDPLDIAEAKQVTYLLSDGVGALVPKALKEIAANPLGVLRALRAVATMVGHAKGNRLKQFVYFLEAVRLKQEAKARGIDHLHTHFSTNSASVVMLSHLLGGPQYSITVHGPDELYVMAENSMTLKVRHARFVAAITDYCQGVVNDHTKGAFADKVHIVRCGLDLRDFATQTPVPDTQDLICVGRLCEAKDQSTLVEAFARDAGDHPEARLILIGDGDLRPVVEAKIAEHGLADRVALAGWMQNDQVRDTLVAARALVLPSLAEGLPIVIMESFALQRPVLTTEINGIPELVDETCGWVAQPGDLETLTASLHDLLSKDPQTLTEMGAVGRARVETLHNQDTNAAELRALFERYGTARQ